MAVSCLHQLEGRLLQRRRIFSKYTISDALSAYWPQQVQNKVQASLRLDLVTPEQDPLSICMQSNAIIIL